MRRSPSASVAFISGTARGFSGFGSALIFMPLASSIADAAAGRGPAAHHRFHRRRAAAAGRVAKGRPQGDLDHGVRRADRRPHRNLFPQPSRAGDDALDHLRLRVRAAVAAAVGLALPRQGPRGRSRSASAACPASAAGSPRPAARRSSATGSAARLPSVIARANIAAVLRRVGFLFRRQLRHGRSDHDWMRSSSSLVVGPVYGIGVWFGASLFGKASEAVFRSICYALIAAAVIFGLPALDGVLR